MSDSIMVNEVEGKIWTTEALVFFGTWLNKKEEYGYGLLCIHGSVLGLKLSAQLKLKWGDFIDPRTDECYKDLEYTNGRPINIQINHYIQRITQAIFASIYDGKNVNYDSPVYVNKRTGKILTTSSLSRELQRFYEQFKKEIYDKTLLELKFREMKYSTFEIAWGRDMVKHYYYSKKVFIAVSKYMGHRTLNDTIKLLELKPYDDIILRHDLYNPDVETEVAREALFEDPIRLRSYLFKYEMAGVTPAFMEARDKSNDEDNTELMKDLLE